MSPQLVTKLPAPDSEPITTDLDGWKVVSGSPTMKTWILHKATDGTMISGYWEATPGTYHTTYDKYEFVHVIAGRVTITPDGGEPIEFKAGDAFAVEAGFKGTWVITEQVRKHFAIRLA